MVTLFNHQNLKRKKEKYINIYILDRPKLAMICILLKQQTEDKSQHLEINSYIALHEFEGTIAREIF